MEHFFTLTPERVLDAVERAGYDTTGLCYPLNSLENRVYEVELDDRSRVVGKFYRPGRWSEETIRDEHCTLSALYAVEIPVCAPISFGDGDTLHTTEDGIFFALFPRTGGRSPDELVGEQFEQLGRLLARIHNVTASLRLQHRPTISPQTYGTDCLETIIKHTKMPTGLNYRYTDAVQRLVAIGKQRFDGIETIAVHGDCHRANLLCGSHGWFFLDFDDMGIAPAVQDIWLLLPARPADCPKELDLLLEGYQQFRDFDRQTLRLIEVLRGLRYVRYAAWIARRWDDPSFPHAFPDWGSERYWEAQVADIYEQLALLEL
ncbi:MAG: serine/threonine protein kinase [Pseudomonadota bacterium]